MNEDTTKEMSPDDRIITAINVLRVDMQNQINDLRVDVQGRFDKLETEVGQTRDKANQIHREIELIHREIDLIHQEINATRQAFDSRLNVLEEKVGGLEEKFNNLEEKVDSRMRETKPIWESVIESLKIMDAKFDVIGAELLDLRGETQYLKRKLPPAA